MSTRNDEARRAAGLITITNAGEHNTLAGHRHLVAHLQHGGDLEGFLVKALRFLSPGMLRDGAAVLADPRAARALQRRLHAEGREQARTVPGEVA